MIRTDQIPDEARQAAANKWFDGAKWEEIVAAALSAWPGWSISPYAPVEIGKDYIILPLPPKNGDA